MLKVDKIVDTTMRAGGGSETFETYTCDYWLKLYAGMALQGLLVDPNVSMKRTITLAAEAAHKLVDEMFKDEE